MRKRRPTRNLNWFAIGFVFLPILAVIAFFWAMEMMSALENYRSPLSDNPPATGEKVGDPLTRRIVIVLFDALRLDTSMDSTIMPTLNLLREEGASATMVSRPPSFSAPGFTTILTGAWPDINDSQPVNPPEGDLARTFTQDDIFAAAERINLRTAVYGYSWFDEMLAKSGVDEGFFTEGDDSEADQEVVAVSIKSLEEDFALVLIHIDQIDYAGHHEGGPLDPNWNRAAARSDSLLALIIENMDFQKDTIIVVSDHGQIDKGGHGGNEPVTLEEPFVAFGAGIIPGHYAEIRMVDIAPTLAVLLGTSIPSSNQGRPLLELLTVTPDQAANILEVVKVQQSNLLSAYAQAIEMDFTPQESGSTVASTQLALEKMRMGKLAQERVWRNMIALFLLLVPGYMLYLRRDRRIFWLLLGALVFLGTFIFRFIVVDKNSFGLSWIPGQAEYILYMAGTIGVSLVLGWTVVMLGLHSFKQSPHQSASASLGFTWLVLLILAIPILLNFSVNGVSLKWTLPEFNTYFLGLISLTVVLFVSAFGLLLSGISVLITKLLIRRK